MSPQPKSNAKLKPCSQNTPDCRSGFWNSKIRPCCKKHLFEILNSITDALEENNIKYWMDYGTLLGATRNYQFIPHDKDMDICCMEEDKDKIIEVVDKVCAEKGYSFFKGAFNKTGFQIRYSKINKKHLDIFLWYKDGDMLRRRYYLGLNSSFGTDTRKGKDFPAEWVKQVRKVKFGARSYFAPLNPQKMCLHRYGKTWKTPMRGAQFNRAEKPKPNDK